MNFYLITSNLEVAELAIDSGVNSIFVDMETLGKEERQKNLNLHLASHNVVDIKRLSTGLPKRTEILVRLNPLNQNSEYEFDQALSNGATKIMFPMIRSDSDFIEIARINRKRSPIVYLIETKEALESIDKWVNYIRVGDRVHFGLNDLSISFGMRFLFMPLALGLLDRATSILRQSRIEFGIGGLSKIGSGLISPELILSEHVRLGSSWVILSRSFHGGSAEDFEQFKKINFRNEILNVKYSLEIIGKLSPSALKMNHEKFKYECIKYG